jgi:WD40 repeat protein
VELDLNDTVDDIERSISTCCGNLIYVDGNKKVQMHHLTVREFLTCQGMQSDFKIDRAAAHKRIALVCLRYLMRNEKRPSQPRKLSVTQVQETPRLAAYACEYVFQHILHVSSTDSEVLVALSKFMGSESVLSWIEQLAMKGDLQRLFQAGKTISNLLNRLAQHSPMIGLRKELTLLQSWGSDLIHLVTKFGRELSFSPSAIYSLIPPFCPLDSAPYRQFASLHRGLKVDGQSSEGWSDCLSIFNYPKPSRPLTIAVSQRFFAIGLSNGKITLYDDVTCQEMHTFQHGEPVWALVFSENGDLCASAGAKKVRVWDLSDWSEKFSTKIASTCLALTFAEHDVLLFAAIKNNELICWNIERDDTREITTNWTSEFDEQSDLQSRQPTLAAFFPDRNLLAVVYRGKNIVLWDYAQDRLHDMYGKEVGSTLHPKKVADEAVADGATTVWSLVFTVLGDDMLLAAAYSDGDLVIYDINDGSVREVLQAVNAQEISCSSDGRTLACADSLGTIQLVDMETNKLLYRLEFEGDAIPPRSLAFTSDSHRIIDVRANQCRLWDPAVLLRQDMDDENSDTVSVSTGIQEVNFQGSMAAHVTAIEYVPGASIVFCGKEDGSVHAYDIWCEPQATLLFTQTLSVPIILIHFNPDTGLLACSDAASRLTIRTVTRKPQNSWILTDAIVDSRVGKGITTLLSSAKFSRCLASAGDQTYVWTLLENVEDRLMLKEDNHDQGQWIQHGTDPDILLLVSATTVQLYKWSTFERTQTVLLTSLNEPFTTIGRVLPLHHPRYFVAVAVDPLRTQSSQNVVYIYDFEDFNDKTPSAQSAQSLGTLSLAVNVVIGVFAERLVFLDVNNWICSVGIGSAEPVCSRHFFIPSDWVSLVQKLMLDVGYNGEIVLVKRADILVIKRGLEVTEKGIPIPRKRSISPKSPGHLILPFRRISH